MQKNATFQFNLSLTISPPQNCSYFSYTSTNYPYIVTVPSHTKTMNWSMSSDYYTWEGVTCEHNTSWNVIGLKLQPAGRIHTSKQHSLPTLSSPIPQCFFEWLFPVRSVPSGICLCKRFDTCLSNTGFTRRVPSGISHALNTSKPMFFLIVVYQYRWVVRISLKRAFTWMLCVIYPV